MKLIYDDISLEKALKSRDTETIISHLREKVSMGGADYQEQLLLGICHFMDCENTDDARLTLETLLNTSVTFDAAVWGVYVNTRTTTPPNCPFQKELERFPNSAVAQYLLAESAFNRGDYPVFLERIVISTSLRKFPFNLIKMISSYPGLERRQRWHYWKLFEELVICKNIEISAEVSTVESYLQRYWDNLILGTRITSPLWEHLKETIKIKCV